MPTTAIGTDAFQEADIIGISRFCTKWNVMVKNVSELPRRINEAFHIATSGRPGPVLVDLPKDITAGVLKQQIDHFPDLPALRKRHLVSEIDQTQTIKRVGELINQAKRPVIYAGQGILQANAQGLLKQLAEQGYLFLFFSFLITSFISFIIKTDFIFF